MPQPRRHKNNAAKQKAYRERKKAREAAIQHPTSRPRGGTPVDDGMTEMVRSSKARPLCNPEVRETKGM